MRRTGRRRLGAVLAAVVMMTLGGCVTTHPRPSVLLDPDSPALQERAPDHFNVRLETSQGPVLLAVQRDLAPHGVDRFYTLVRHGFFDGERFFRVRAGYIAQFGLNGNPVIIAAWKHRAMPDDPVRESNLRGTLGYAMTGPDTRTTQIYINLVDNPQLDAQGFAPFASVIGGMDNVLRLYSGYGESAGGGVRAGKQGAIEAGGNVYLAQHFPRLDYIRQAVIVQP